MKILHLEASSGWGGQEIRILREATGMRERGHEIFFGIQKGGALASRARGAGFTVYELNFSKPAWPVSLLRLLWIMKRHPIALVNTHSSLDSWIGGIAARLARKRIVRTRHLSTPTKAGWNSRMVYGKLADFVVTTCSSILPTICQQSGKRADQCRSIPTGIDPEAIRLEGDFRKHLGLSETHFLVGTACFMRSWKGIDDLLKAADLLRAHADLKWVIIGGGHAERPQIRARELNLENIVFFTGHLENPFPALAALDLFALLSTAHEGISQATLQAAYLGKPLITTTIGGLPEVCIDSVTGFTVPPFSPSEVARAVLFLKASSLLREQFGSAARELVLERFTFKQTLDAMEEVYTT